MNRYKLTITLPNTQDLVFFEESDSFTELKYKYESIFTFDYDQGLWVHDTFLPEDVIKNSIFKIEEI